MLRGRVSHGILLKNHSASGRGAKISISTIGCRPRMVAESKMKEEKRKGRNTTSSQIWRRILKTQSKRVSQRKINPLYPKSI